jgi:hypothetical protein
LWQRRRLHRVAAQLKSAAPSGVVAVAEGTPADTAVVARRDQGATVVAVVVGGRHMRGRAMGVARASRVNTAVAAKGVRNMAAIVLMPTATAGRNTAVATAGDRTMLVIAAMPTATA